MIRTALTEEGETPEDLADPDDYQMLGSTQQTFIVFQLCNADLCELACLIAIQKNILCLDWTLRGVNLFCFLIACCMIQNGRMFCVVHR